MEKLTTFEEKLEKVGQGGRKSGLTSWFYHLRTLECQFLSALKWTCIIPAWYLQISFKLSSDITLKHWNELTEILTNRLSGNIMLC